MHRDTYRSILNAHRTYTNPSPQGPTRRIAIAGVLALIIAVLVSPASVSTAAQPTSASNSKGPLESPGHTPAARTEEHTIREAGTYASKAANRGLLTGSFSSEGARFSGKDGSFAIGLSTLQRRNGGSHAIAQSVRYTSSTAVYEDATASEVFKASSQVSSRRSMWVLARKAVAHSS